MEQDRAAHRDYVGVKPEIFAAGLSDPKTHGVIEVFVCATRWIYEVSRRQVEGALDEKGFAAIKLVMYPVIVISRHIEQMEFFTGYLKFHCWTHGLSF